MECDSDKQFKVKISINLLIFFIPLLTHFPFKYTKKSFTWLNRSPCYKVSSHFHYLLMEIQVEGWTYWHSLDIEYLRWKRRKQIEYKKDFSLKKILMKFKFYIFIWIPLKLILPTLFLVRLCDIKLIKMHSNE